MTHAEAALYLFLVCVADQKGLSYYGDKSIMKRLRMDLKTLKEARSGLIQNSLIAWQNPIYQVLCLEPAKEARYSGSLTSLKDIFQNAKEA